MRSLSPLPVDPFLPEILAAVRTERALVLVAEPGAGKTTRVAPALTVDGPVLLLQPRRIAARAISRHIAAEQGWHPGEEVGWQVRFERRFGPATRLLVATEGILTARAQADPLLSDFATVILDEFHERSLHGDLALALARQAWLARRDLRLVVMSATLDVDALSAFLDGCLTVRVPGRRHPLSVNHAASLALPQAIEMALDRTPGSVLAFLPGAGEIRRAAADVAPLCSSRAIDVLPLHGSLPAEAQDEAIRPSARRRVILATNVAETSLTVPGVTAVVDSGLHKVVRFDQGRGIDTLETERITQDAADQRAGRAGRVGPGTAWRLWDARDRLRPHREPEIARVDLCGLTLDVLAWGAQPNALQWLDPPAPDRVDAALALLRQLGAVHGMRLTPLGERLHRLPLHPRLGRILLAADGAREAARACALLSERAFLPLSGETTTCDLMSWLDDWPRVPGHIERAAREFERLAQLLNDDGTRQQRRLDEREFRRALTAGYPDRLARRRDPGSPRLLLASGHGAVLARESGVRDAEFLVAVDVQGGQGEALVRIASAVEREWIAATETVREHRFDAARGTVRAFEIVRHGEIVLDERPAPVDPVVAASWLAEAFLSAPLAESDEQTRRRLAFAGIAIDVPGRVRDLALGARSLDDLSYLAALPHDARAALDRLAPLRLSVPSGRTVALHYREDGGVEAAVKLQELFGLADTPRLGPRRQPVVFALLAPNGRPVQVTSDLKSFWTTGYQQVRKELRGRYPRHPWPEDPWTAIPTSRTKPR